MTRPERLARTLRRVLTDEEGDELVRQLGGIPRTAIESALNEIALAADAIDSGGDDAVDRADCAVIRARQHLADDHRTNRR